jgi:hypothetical protein
MVAGETANGDLALDPALAAAYGAIGALFGLVTWLAKGRIERCEKREDTMLAADAEKTTTLRELVTAVSKSADVTASAVTAANGAVEESRRNGARLESLGGTLDAVNTAVGNLSRTVADLSRTIERLPDSSQPRR